MNHDFLKRAGTFILEAGSAPCKCACKLQSKRINVLPALGSAIIND
jgi:hypothetical protein